jgi:hypothetical protein
MRRLFLAGLLLWPLAASAADLPDHAKTPGEANPALTKEVICAKGFTTKNYRNVPAALKRKVYAAYHVRNHAGYCVGKEGCEVDHLISLEIGGANSIKNLWPQAFAGTKQNAHVKDELENRLHDLLCAGKMELEDIQACIAIDWIECYKEVMPPK